MSCDKMRKLRSLNGTVSSAFNHRKDTWNKWSELNKQDIRIRPEKERAYGDVREAESIYIDVLSRQLELLQAIDKCKCDNPKCIAFKAAKRIAS